MGHFRAQTGVELWPRILLWLSSMVWQFRGRNHCLSLHTVAQTGACDTLQAPVNPSPRSVASPRPSVITPVVAVSGTVAFAAPVLINGARFDAPQDCKAIGTRAGVQG